MPETLCDNTWPITWNCNCATAPGNPDCVMEAVTVKIGNGTAFQGCLVVCSGKVSSLCCPGAQQGNNGDTITCVDTATPPNTTGGTILVSGDDVSFCWKEQLQGV